IVDQMHHEKNIDRDIIFEGIEAALQLATQKKYGEESGVVVSIDRDSGEIHARKGEEDIDPAELGRIAAQSAKQVMIQKIRETESRSSCRGPIPISCGGCLKTKFPKSPTGRSRSRPWRGKRATERKLPFPASTSRWTAWAPAWACAARASRTSLTSWGANAST